MKLEINEECMEQLFLAMLVQDYKFAEEGIAELKQIKKDFGGLASYQQEDYKAYKRQRKALKVMFDIYTVDGGEKALGGAV